MAKTVAPAEVGIPHIGTFIANALPDPFSERDLQYRPRPDGGHQHRAIAWRRRRRTWSAGSDAARQPLHALPPGPALRLGRRRGRRRVLATRRAQELVQPRRAPRGAMAIAGHGPSAQPRRGGVAGADAPLAAGTFYRVNPSAWTICSRPSRSCTPSAPRGDHLIKALRGTPQARRAGAMRQVSADYRLGKAGKRRLAMGTHVGVRPTTSWCGGCRPSGRRRCRAG